jgi:hypothetical protein
MKSESPIALAEQTIYCNRQHWTPIEDGKPNCQIAMVQIPTRRAHHLSHSLTLVWLFASTVALGVHAPFPSDASQIPIRR